MASKIKKDDLVIIIAGKDKGKTGKILVVADQRVKVEGVNMVCKHTRPNPQQGVEGGRVFKEALLHISNVAIYNAATKKADRVGFKTLEDGKKQRVYRSTNEIIIEG
jgi:large subunit ribosomal protein L24